MKIIKEIREKIEKELGVDISINKRTRPLVYSRALFFKIARMKTGKSLAEIGKEVGRDHSSVLHGLKLFEQVISYNEQPYLDIYEKLMLEITTIKSNSFVSQESYYEYHYNKLLIRFNEERLHKKDIIHKYNFLRTKLRGYQPYLADSKNFALNELALDIEIISKSI